MPTNYWAYSFIRTLAASGITSGCGGGNFCPASPVNRAQMAVFLERGIRGGAYVPPPATGAVFGDVGASDFAAAYIEQLSADGITAGCGGGNYCPDALVTRAQMAVFLLRATFGAGYAPPPANGRFADVPPGSFAAAWIEALAAQGISGGCGGGNFCPNDPVTRAQMAVFMVRAFDLVFSNAAPTVDGGSYTTSDAAVLSATLAGSDPEGDPLTYAVAELPMKGTVTFLDTATGAFTYEPSPQQDGPDSFTVTVSDPYQVSAAATVNIEIFRWPGTRQFGTPAIDYSTTSGLFFDANGDLVLGGYTEGQIGSAPSAGQRDGWIRKFDRRGNEAWTIQAGNANGNNFRIVARVPGTNNIVAILTDDDTEAASIVKLDTAGNAVLDAPVNFQNASDLLVGTYWGNVDADGDVYIISWSSVSSSLLTKVNSMTGATDWQVQFEGTADNDVTPFDSDWSDIRLRSVDFDAAGNLIVSGGYRVAPGAATRNCELCPFAASFDAAGSLLWVTEMDLFARACVPNPNASAEAIMYRLMVAPDGTLWATGSYSTGFTEADVAFSQVSRFSADGTQLLWSDCNDASAAGTQVFSFSPTRFAANGDGLVLSFDRVPADPVTNPNGSSTLILTRLTPAGAVAFRRTVTLSRADGTPANVEPGDIAEDDQGLLYISGSTDGEFVSGGALGDIDAFVLRLDADGLPTN